MLPALPSAHSPTLADAPTGQPCRLLPVPDPTLRVALARMGFTPGVEITPLLAAPGGCPLAVRIGSVTVAIRRAEARRIPIRPLT